MEGDAVTIALPKGDFLVTAGFAAIAGAGVASSFTVFDDASTWYLVLVAVVTLGAYPLLCIVSTYGTADGELRSDN